MNWRLDIIQKGDGGRKCIKAMSVVRRMGYTLKLQHKIGFHYFHASNSGRSALQAWLFIYVLSTRFGMLQQIHTKSGSALLPQTSIWEVQVDVKSTCPFQHQGLDLMHCFQNVDPWCESGWHRNSFSGNGMVPRNWMNCAWNFLWANQIPYEERLILAAYPTWTVILSCWTGASAYRIPVYCE